MVNKFTGFSDISIFSTYEVLNLQIKLTKTVNLFKNSKIKISQNRYISDIRARRHRHITRVHKV